MDQAVVEQAMEEHLVQEHGIFVQYSTECLSLEVNEGRTPGYPITLAAMRKPTSVADATMMAMKAKYLVGADGSRSWTRNQTGIRMLGARTSTFLLTTVEKLCRSDNLLRSTILGCGRYCTIVRLSSVHLSAATA